MIRSLIWKELREHRLAIIIGMCWALAPVAFWVKLYDVQLPVLLKAALEGVGMVAPGITMLLLSCAPFYSERRRGTWEYLQTLPLPRKHIMIVKWMVPLSLGAAFMSLSSAGSWYPLTRLEPWLAQTGFFYWVSMHVAASALLMSILLLLDTPDWGDWLGLRAVVSFALISAFLVFMQLSAGALSWGSVIWCAVLSLASFMTAIYAFPFVSGESVLPGPGVKGRMTRHRFDGDGAILWLHWRQMRYIIILLLLPVPLLLSVQLLAFASQGDAWSRISLLPSHLLSTAIAWPMSALMCICAALAGAALPVVDRQANAISFSRCLPYRRARSQRLQLAFTIGLLILIFSPAFVFSTAQTWFTGGSWRTLLVNEAWLLAWMTCICAGELILVSLTSLFSRLNGLIIIGIGICGLIYILNYMIGRDVSAIWYVAVAAIVTIAAAGAVLPIIDKMREA